jgi:hypothetical protein
MTLARESTWRNLDLQYWSSMAHRFTRYTLGLDYASLLAEVLHQAKRCLEFRYIPKIILEAS